MIVYDLNSLVGDRFQKAHIDTARTDEEQVLVKENWAVVVGRDPFLLRNFVILFNLHGQKKNLKKKKKIVVVKRKRLNVVNAMIFI
jgi:hypothetical protein